MLDYITYFLIYRVVQKKILFVLNKKKFFWDKKKFFIQARWDLFEMKYVNFQALISETRNYGVKILKKFFS